MIEAFPYTITMIYQLLLELRDYLPPPDYGSSAGSFPQPLSALQNEMNMMKFVLEKQSVRWEISRMYNSLRLRVPNMTPVIITLLTYFVLGQYVDNLNNMSGNILHAGQ